MIRFALHRYSDPAAFSLGLEDLASAGLTPRGLLFLALEPTGAIHVAVADPLEGLDRIKIGDKLALASPFEGRLYHFDSIHRLGRGLVLFTGDRRLHHAGDAEDTAGALGELLRRSRLSSVFFGCTPHQPGTWIASQTTSVRLHDHGFIGAVPFEDQLVARRIMDHRLWLLEIGGARLHARRPVFESPLGNILMLERRAVGGKLVLSCEHGLVEVDLSRLPDVSEHARAETEPGYAVVGRIGDGVFAVTRGRVEQWGLDQIQPAELLGSNAEAQGLGLPALGPMLGGRPA